MMKGFIKAYTSYYEKKSNNELSKPMYSFGK